MQKSIVLILLQQVINVKIIRIITYTVITFSSVFAYFIYVENSLSSNTYSFWKNWSIANCICGLSIIFHYSPLKSTLEIDNLASQSDMKFIEDTNWFFINRRSHRSAYKSLFVPYLLMTLINYNPKLFDSAAQEIASWTM